MRTKFLLFFISLFFLNCNKKNTLSKNCLTSKTVSVQFFEPFNFSRLDTLIIDNIKYTHAYLNDSINALNVLPKEKVILFEREGKEAIANTNKISIARILAYKLKSTGDYIILNIPEVMISGTIKFKRVDDKAVKICATKNYLANFRASEK